MDQPLGNAVGNMIEVREAIDTLMGKGPDDFVELCLTLGSEMVVAGKKASNSDAAREMLIQKIQSGEALHKLAGFIKAQGGDSKYVYEPDRFVYGNITASVFAQQEGFVSHIDCDEIGICSLLLGGGRKQKRVKIYLSVFIFTKRLEIT